MFPNNFPTADRFKDNDDVRIKFLTGATYVENKLYVNPSIWILKSYYNKHGLNSKKVSWLDPVFNNEFFSKEEMLKTIETEKPNVLCFGLYIWNNPLYASIGKYVKENWPDIVLIAGGPNIYAHKDLSKFWKEYSWLDAVAYGDGEKAFATIIDTLIDSSQIESGSNISYISDSGENVLLPHERFKDKDFTFVSPVIENKDSITKEIRKLREQDPNVQVCINWDFTRGCPYACTFCDWSSGLHHKISRKKYDWKQDLDFFASLNITVEWADGNVGMFKDDIDIIKYSYSLEKDHPGFVLVYHNFAKLHKKAVFDIIDFVESKKPGETMFTFSVQDIDEVILKNIDRPDIPWPEHKKYIFDTKAKHPNIKFFMGIIVGLPGQTIKHMDNMLNEFAEVGAIFVTGNLWVLLINSPAYEESYREQHKIKIKNVSHIYLIDEKFDGRDDLFNNLDRCNHYTADTIIETYSADLAEIMAMYGMGIIYQVLVNKLKKVDRKLISAVMGKHEYWQDFGKKMARIMEQDYEKYGVMLTAIPAYGKQMTLFEYFESKETLQEILRYKLT